MPTNPSASRPCWLFCFALLSIGVLAVPPSGFCQEYVEIAARPANASPAKKVIVHVWVVELETEKLRNLGFDWSQIKARGGPETLLGGSTGELANAMSAAGDANQFQGFLKALEQNSLARTLAQPTITTLSGRPASFAVGPMQLEVTPTAIDDQRLQLQYRIEVGREKTAATSVPFVADSTVELEAGKACVVGQTRSTAQTAAGKSRQTETLLLIQADYLKSAPAAK